MKNDTAQKYESFYCDPSKGKANLELRFVDSAEAVVSQEKAVQNWRKARARILRDKIDKTLWDLRYLNDELAALTTHTDRALIEW